MVRRRRRGSEHPPVRPFDVDGVRTVAIGTVLWAVAFGVLAMFRDDLDEQGMGWWLWTCLAGVGLGLLGLEYTRKRRDAIARARLREEADRPDDVDPVPQTTDLGATESRAEPEPVHAEQPAAPADPEPARTEQLAAPAWPEPAQTEQLAAPAEPEPAQIERPSAPSQPEPVQTKRLPAPSQPEPVQTERLPAPSQPEPAPAESHSQPAEAPPAGLLDVEPLLPAPTPASRRARREARTVDQGEQTDDEPLLPMANDGRAATDGRTPEGRRVRRGDAPDDDQVSESDSSYRPRRARRP